MNPPKEPPIVFDPSEDYNGRLTAAILMILKAAELNPEEKA